LIADIGENGSASKYNKICVGYHTSYTGPDHCAYNIAMAFAEAREYLSSQVSKDEKKWVWRNVHATIYPSTPWS